MASNLPQPREVAISLQVFFSGPLCQNFSQVRVQISLISAEYIKWIYIAIRTLILIKNPKSKKRKLVQNKDQCKKQCGRTGKTCVYFTRQIIPWDIHTICLYRSKWSLIFSPDLEAQDDTNSQRDHAIIYNNRWNLKVIRKFWIGSSKQQSVIMLQDSEEFITGLYEESSKVNIQQKSYTLYWKYLFTRRHSHSADTVDHSKGIWNPQWCCKTLD